MAARSDALSLAVKVVVYISLYFAAAFVLVPVMTWLGSYFFGVTTSGFLAAVITNVLCLRIYERRGIAAIGLQSDKPAFLNLVMGLIGGVGSAALVLAGPLLFRGAHIVRDPASRAGLGSFIFVSVLLLFGSAGEEILFRGFGFQTLLRSLGSWTVVVPVGVIFAALHGENPNANWLGLLNTAGFGILFGYAFLRSRDIWLPIGLHYGWNFTLSLLGVKVSGLDTKLLGFDVQWSAGPLWSGGEYGPEASVLTSFVLLALFLYLWKAPIRRQPSALLDSPPAA